MKVPMPEHAKRIWPGDRLAAVSLTYDGTTINHVETVLPLLYTLDLQATFYAYSTNLLDAVPLWREVYRQGNEIGDGCLVEAAEADGSLPNWTPEMIASEMEMTALLLDDLFIPIRERSFGYPWGMPRCLGTPDYREIIAATSMVARAGVTGLNSPGSCDLSYLNCIPVNDMSSDELVAHVVDAASTNKWIILSFAGVGMGERGLDASEHQQFCKWLSVHREEFWIRPVIDVATQVRSHRTTVVGVF